MRDDVVGVLEEEGDLAQGRPTVVLAKAGELGGSGAAAGARGALGPAEMAGALRESGALDAAIAHANGLVDEALAALCSRGSRPGPRRRSRSSPRSSRSGILSMMEAELTPTLRRTACSDLAGALPRDRRPRRRAATRPARGSCGARTRSTSRRDVEAGAGSTRSSTRASPSSSIGATSGPSCRAPVLEGSVEAVSAEQASMRATMSAWHQKYRSLLSGDGFERFARSVPGAGLPKARARAIRHLGPSPLTCDGIALPTCCPPVADPGPWVCVLGAL